MTSGTQRKNTGKAAEATRIRGGHQLALLLALAGSLAAAMGCI